MVRRSDHCLPSDSDKFTIKLHSLPSKFLSSSSCLFPPSPYRAPSRSLPFLPVGFPAIPSHRGSFSVDTWELLRRRVLVYSLAITITLGTPAPPCPSILSRFSLRPFLLPVRVLPALSLSPSRVRSLCTCIYVCASFSLSLGLLSSLLRHVVPSLSLVLSLVEDPDHPVASATAIPQLFSSFLALVAAAAAAAGDALRAFRYRGTLPAVFPSLSLSSPRFFIRFVSLILSPSLSVAHVGHPSLQYLFLDLCRTFPSDFLPPSPPFHSPNGHRNS